nr:Druantia anti-phage system protein DruA [Nitrosomonas sp. Nm51]
MNLGQLSIRPVRKVEEPRYLELIQQYHYPGDLAKIGHTLWYVTTHGDEWAALLSFSAAAWKCGVRDRWIGWDFRHQYDRLKLIANNSRFLILPEWHYPNLGSKALSLCRQRIAGDWRTHFGQSLLLLETFDDPSRFHGTVYRAANWTCLGLTRGYSRTRDGYSTVATSPKKEPDFVEIAPPDHGRIETRRIWCSTAPNEHLDFPHVGQVFLSERESFYKKTRKVTHEVVLGVTNRSPEQACPERILKVNRGHWMIENRCHYVIDWNFDEDRAAASE